LIQFTFFLKCVPKIAFLKISSWILSSYIGMYAYVYAQSIK
jgi:hypothetical protein